MNGHIPQFSWEILSSTRPVYRVAWRDIEGRLIALEVLEAPSAGEAVARTATVTVSVQIQRQQQ